MNMRFKGWFSRAGGVSAVVLAMLLAAPCAFSASSEWTRTDLLEARLISATDATGDLRNVPLGLELKIKPGWKTYWRSPGDAGLPPRIDWSGSENLASADLAYPAPHRFELFGLQTFGYADHVVFPVSAEPEKPGEAMTLKAHAEILVCEDICVPQSFDLALALPEGEASPAAEAQTLAKFRSKVPRKDGGAGLNVTSVREVMRDGKPALEVGARSQTPFTAPDIFVELEPETALGKPIVTLNSDGKAATLVLPVTEKIPAGRSLAGRSATLTLVDNGRSVEQTLQVAPGAPADRTAELLQLAGIIGLALIGGLLLNVMPCVLPVLALKMMSVVSHGGAPPATIRASFLATAAGILASFALIAVALILLRFGGQLIGWGIQFQQPGFIAFMAVVVTLFAANLWDLFEIRAPAAFSRAGSGASGLAGDFGTGLFATLLATPCSAPFLGTAVGFALAGGAELVLIIFGALGVGFAAPYLAVAAFPAIAAKLPRPGGWMIYVKRLLGLALAGTALWLLWVLSEQVGLRAGLAVGMALLGLLAVLLVNRLAKGRLARIAGASAALLAVIAIAAPIFNAAGPNKTSYAASGRIDWSAFDRQAIRGLVAQGETVFVNVTADWCITCKANEQFVIETDAVTDRLANGAVPMRADWSRPDPEITSFLSTYGRFGIPFNIVYGPGAPSGIVLPELLTQEAVLDALDKASRAEDRTASSSGP